MNQRYVLLDSTYRNRNDYPNPFDFVAKSATSQAITKISAGDWASLNAPIVSFDMYDYFSTNDGTAAPYRWIQTGDITSSPQTTNIFQVTIDARGNAGDAPDLITGQYDGLEFLYDNGTTVYNYAIDSFVDVGGNTFVITLPYPIEITASVDFQINTPYLQDNEAYIPIPVAPLAFTDASYTGLQLVEYVQREISTVVGSLNRVVQATTDFTLSLPDYPRHFAIQQSATFVQYEVQSVSNVTHTITIDVADNPTYTAPDFSYQYIYDFVNGFTAQILSSATVAGVITLTFPATTDLSAVTVSDLLAILFYSGDQASTLDYKGSMRETQSNDRSQVRVYNLELLSLQIPNQLLATSIGGYPVAYSYFMVTLRNMSYENRVDQVIFSNNPALGRANFIVPVLDISSPQFSSFTKLDGGAICYPFSIKSNDTLQLTISTPSGDILATVVSDTVPPIPPNPSLQVSALFSITNQMGVDRECKY